jgi:hypothetical protein
MAKKVTLPLSSARARLFQLADLVSQSGEIVVLERRGGAEPVALVREARLAYLEARVAEIDKRTGAPFRLAGSLETAVDAGQVAEDLRAIRREWSADANAPTARPRPTRRRRG